MYRCTSVVIHTNIYYPTKFFFFVKFSQYSLHVLNILFTFAVGYPLLVGGGGEITSNSSARTPGNVETLPMPQCTDC
jgi:hypothetical protein